MMRDGLHKRQNSERSLDRLAAQRFLYQQVKIVDNWRLVSVFFVGILLLLGPVVEVAVFSQAATILVVLLWFLDQAVLVKIAGGKKKEAATIQEDFDCYVLEMPWPQHLTLARPTEDRVRDLARRAARGSVVRKEMENWYRADDIPAEAIAARLHCQRMNCYRDGSLRKDWTKTVKFAVWLFVAAGVGLGLVMGVSLLEVVLGIAAGIRLFAWLMMEQGAQSVAQKRMEDLHGYLSRVGAESAQATLCDVRLVQAAIFEHRRVSPTVPEWFYRIRNKAYEVKKNG